MSDLPSESKNLIRDYPIISDQMTKKRLTIILRCLALTLEQNIAGDIVEFGCYKGTTSLFINRVMNLSNASTKELHVYDSFDGLPAKTIKDASVAGSDFKAGELKTSKRDLVRNFKKAGLKPPHIHKGWFDELKDKELPSTIAFAFLDGDFYRSIVDSLGLVWPRLANGGMVVIDDYQKSNLPGVTRAIEDFFTNKSVKIQHQQNLAIIIKQEL